MSMKKNIVSKEYVNLLDDETKFKMSNLIMNENFQESIVAHLVDKASSDKALDMQNELRKKFNDLIQLSGLSNLDMKIISILRKTQKMTSLQIAGEIKDYSSRAVHLSITKLDRLGILYIDTTKPFNRPISLMRQEISEIVNKTLDRYYDLESDFIKLVSKGKN